MNIKLFSVDFDSLSEILNLSNNLRSRVGELRTLPGPNYGNYILNSLERGKRC
jgi:hypothetical protein